MHLRRVITTGMLVLLALACLAPALALASGPSAGDQQYTDPLGGSSGSGSKTTTSPTSSSSAGSSSSSSAPSSSSSSGASQSSSAPAVSSASSSTPTATIAASSPATTSTLPRTGFDLWAGAGIGVVLLGVGMSLRRRAQST